MTSEREKKCLFLRHLRERPRMACSLRRRENPTRALDDFRATSVGNRPTLKRLASNSSGVSFPITGLSVCSSLPLRTLWFPCGQPLPYDRHRIRSWMPQIHRQLPAETHRAREFFGTKNTKRADSTILAALPRIRAVSPPTPTRTRNRSRSKKENSMKAFHAVAVLLAALSGGTLESASAQSASKAGIKNVVLVHGAFADGSGWAAVAKILEKGWLQGVRGPTSRNILRR